MNPLDKRTKWSYTIGATGRDMAYTLVSMFLLTYIQYTMKLSVAQFAAISSVIVICMIWDAFNDPLMGLIIEKANLKMGKYRPWILVGMLLNSCIIIALFSIRPEGWAFVVFFAIFYLLWGMTYTMNDIAYWGMLPSLSSDPKERDTLVTIMSIFICIGQFSVAGLLPTLVAGNAVNAYRTASFVIAGCFIAFQLLTVFGAKERPRSISTTNEALTLKKMFHIFGRNDQLIVIGIASFLFNIGNNLLIAIGMNFFYFEFGYEEGGNLVFIFTVMYGLGTLLSQCAYPLMTKFMNRKKLHALMTLLTILGYCSLLGFGYIIPRNVILLNTIGFIIFFAQGLNNLLIIVMLNNTIEYDEVRFNERHESIISAVRSFSTKLAGAMNQGIITLILIFSGIYEISQKISSLEISAGAGEISNDTVLVSANEVIALTTSHQLLLLRIGMVTIPVLAFAVSYIMIKKKYIIDEKKYAELLDVLKNNN